MEKFIVFIFPFFFLTFTQEYFVTNKLYLLGFGVLLLLLISTIRILISKKISWQKNPFDSLILLFLTAITLSTLFSSPNKIHALLNPNFGLVMMIFLAILYFYLSRQKGPSLSASPFKVGPYIMKVSSIILSIITIVFYFQPFKNIALPQNFAFLKNPTFTPIGSQLDLAILLGFFVIAQIAHILIKKHTESTETSVKSVITSVGSVSLILLALFLTVYSMIRVVQTPNLGVSTIMPPFRLSWFAALEILKNPASAIIGIGPDNFSAIFTRVKDFAYNQSPLWQINSFNVSHSAILQILTETGIFGLLAFGLLVFNVLRVIPSKEGIQERMDSRFHGNDKTLNISVFIYLIICLLIFPPSLIVWFLFFVTLGLINQTPTTDVQTPKLGVSTIDLTDMLPLYFGMTIISFVLIGASGYFLGRSYAAEYYFKKSIEGIAKNNLKQVYDNQRQAIVLNPYIERFRSSFAQTNLVIANNIANKVKTPNLGVSTKLTEQDRQTITQAIQAGIAEGKAVVTLNPQRAGNWENLAVIYSNIINVAQEADVWTISAYQRAIFADPQNPAYRVGLGGVYYSQKKYDDALRFFEQAVSIKPDWPNANYNYAWANFQVKNYPQAVNAMQNTLKLLNQKTNKADYEKVVKELEEFKKMLPKEETPVNKSEESTQSDLNLPTPPTTEISPKLELPKEASPEAK
ncbi:MAG: tetratricopeptide repeat protein [Patescibacteria group bacterium]